ncbi:uncharacterized protein LOC129940898 [Eupeodes corollae]|uniref:uncharacterized protein LOC129940898 n=1 Tax=Eupeodes corollae TaxID=290404 RepID=UPI00248FA3F0|nr:uncharacterized protein LOC129940898 [Eupeodes corollae]
MDNKNKWRKKKQRTRRELTGDWPDDKIRELIYNVKTRPELWDVGNTNYRIARPQSWQAVAMELGEDYDWRDCRLKWQNLRVTYKCNLNKIAKKKSEGTDEVPKILWRFFHLMQFISKKRNHHNASNEMENSILNFDSELTTASRSTLESFKNYEFSQCSSSFIKQESSQTLETPTPISTPTPQPTFDTRCYARTKPSEENPPSKQIMKNKNDEHACFGNFIASELRSLPKEHSFALKRRLNRTILEYWDEMETKAQTVAVAKTEVFENVL